MYSQFVSTACVTAEDSEFFVQLGVVPEGRENNSAYRLTQLLQTRGRGKVRAYVPPAPLHTSPTKDTMNNYMTTT